MRVEQVTVARDVSLAADRWPPNPAAPVGPEAQAPFVLVHGLASNARMWDGVADRLADAGHDVTTVDLRGHGRSSKPDDGYDVATVADDLARLIDVLQLERPILAGQSWGGNVVFDLALRHPACVRGVVLVDGGWIDLQRRFPDWEACRTALAPPRLVGRPLVDVERFMRSAHADWPESGIQGALANFEVRADGTIAPWLTFDRHMAVLRGLWDHRPPDHYADLAVPALLVPAETPGDPRLDAKREDVEAAGAALPRARVRWMAGEHDLHAQQPAALAALLLAAARDGLFA